MADCFETHKSLAKPQECALLVVDVQERLIDSIAKSQEVIANIAALIKTAGLFQIPIVVTEQEKLGSTVPALKELLQQGNAYEPITKQHFSCYPNEAFREALKKTQRKYLLLVGIEAHICVGQTALDLLANDYRIQVVADAVSSHDRQDHQTAIKRLAKAGAIISSTEALIFELTAIAGSPPFKHVLTIVKDRRRSVDR